ncbi:MAG: Zn-dependent protease [unclassified Hahellaceae]|nr:Zn-dependent protease [Hahellaceae bacterium]|tara:strand:- start:6104 stop:6796 length:693 start_codon:yes stop_codon:yes gene_type:complete
MLFVLVIVLVLLLIYGPHLWIRHVMARHGGTLDELPGTGGELARHLIERFDLGDVEVEPTSGGDHYDSAARKVRLSPDIMNGRSLTAVAVAAHEVGHAIQYHRQERITHLRQRYSPLAMTIQKIAIGILLAAPLLAAVFHVPQIALVTVLAGILAMLASALIQMIILPMEWDASFNKALPILIEGEYISQSQYAAARSVLRAAALTYVAAALVDMLRLGRWLAILRVAIR